MNFHFSEEEISLIKDLIETSYACTLGGKELTYGEIVILPWIKWF